MPHPRRRILPQVITTADARPAHAILDYAGYKGICGQRIRHAPHRQYRRQTDMRGNRRMLDEIERDMQYTGHVLGIERLGAPLRDALLNVPRHAFVPDTLQDAAYDNVPLPIGDAQTISQPFIVAVMTELLGLTPEHRVLEIGTGSGYQTAILARLARAVFSIEIVDRLARQAERRLRLLGYANVQVRSGDGYHGWPEAAPFDAVMITAATPAVPPPLFAQLKPGGRLIVPLDTGFDQELVLFSKSPQGALGSRRLLPVAFVPLTGRARGPDPESPS